MDVVYICRYGDNEELKYSLRSLANLQYNNVWVVGGKPSWYAGNFIKVEQNINKYRHAIANLSAIVNSNKISEDFILMNDDFYILKPIKKLEVYNEGLLENKINRYKEFAPKAQYTKRLISTYDYLVSAGFKKPLSYELHIPMQMSKTKLTEVLKTGRLWRSVYGNKYNLGGKKTTDVKVYSKEDNSVNYLNTKLKFLSTEDNSFKEVKENLLVKLFPEKSQYEK
jgi:hypothetical protein